jgi:hypothetical protein
MNRKNPKTFGVLTLIFFISSCTSTPSTPHSAYPVTYNIQVDNTEVGPQSPGVNATQDVTVASGQALYYQVISPVDVTVYFYGVEAPGQRTFLGQMQGREFTSSITPDTNTLEFVFVATQPNSRGRLKFTLSDQSITPLAAQ